MNRTKPREVLGQRSIGKSTISRNACPVSVGWQKAILVEALLRLQISFQESGCYRETGNFERCLARMRIEFA